MKYLIPKLLVLGFMLPLLFVIDICSFFWLQAQASYLLFSFLICLSWYRLIPALLIIGTMLLAAQSLVMYQGSLAPLLLQLTTLSLLIICRERLYLMDAIPPFAFLAYLGALYLVQPYTMEAVFGNLIIIGIFSLKLKTSKTRQSLMPIA